MGRTLFLPTSLKIVASVGAAFVLWGLVLAYTSSPAHAATTYIVDRTDDPDLSTTPTAGACTATANDCSLRGAITAANANAGDDTIDLLGVSGTVNLTGVLPDLSTNIKIEGPGADKLTVRRDSGGDYRIFHTTSVVFISGLTISNGKTADTGGGIFSDEGSLTVTDSTVSGNSAGFIGGGIANNIGGTLTITDSTVSGNSVTSAGSLGGGVSSDHGPLTLTGSTVRGNTADDGGGGIFSFTNLSGQTTTITNSTISGNTTTKRGGGGVYNSRGLTVIEHSTITNNTAPD